jgi:hypothetical protein
MTARACALCAESESRCLLCLGEIGTAQELALEAEGTRIALEFAERGETAGVRLEPEFALTRRG